MNHESGNREQGREQAKWQGGESKEEENSRTSIRDFLETSSTCSTSCSSDLWEGAGWQLAD